jgi:hypothetical protein
MRVSTSLQTNGVTETGLAVVRRPDHRIVISHRKPVASVHKVQSGHPGHRPGGRMLRTVLGLCWACRRASPFIVSARGCGAQGSSRVKRAAADESGTNEMNDSRVAFDRGGHGRTSSPSAPARSASADFQRNSADSAGFLKFQMLLHRCEGVAVMPERVRPLQARVKPRAMWKRHST